MNIFDTCQLLGGVLLAGSYIPQILQLHKTKNSDSQSLAFWGILTGGLVLMLINALHLVRLGVYSYAITQILNVLGASIVLIQSKKYKGV